MPTLISLVKGVYRSLPEAPSTNYLYRQIEPNPYSLLPPNPVIFDIGSKEVKAGYAFGTPPSGAKIVCVDIQAGPGVDLVADAHDLHMVPDNSVDFVSTVSVLEHVRYPQRVVAEIFRILKPGGTVYVSVPFVFPYHADPDDFYRFSHRGVSILCEAFDRVDSGFNRGPASTMHHLLVHFLALLFSFNTRGLYAMNLYILRWLLFWVKYLDKFLARHPMAYVIHAGAYFIGQKPLPRTSLVDSGAA